MISIFFLLVSLSPATAPPANSSPTLVVDESPTTAPSEFVDQTRATARGTDLIFENGFENGTYQWSEATNYLRFETTTAPIVPILDCNLPPGTYTLRVAADNLDAGIVHEYTMTVGATFCGIWPCLQVDFSDPVISFR